MQTICRLSRIFNIIWMRLRRQKQTMSRPLIYFIFWVVPSQPSYNKINWHYKISILFITVKVNFFICDNQKKSQTALLLRHKGRLPHPFCRLPALLSLPRDRPEGLRDLGFQHLHACLLDVLRVVDVFDHVLEELDLVVLHGAEEIVCLQQVGEALLKEVTEVVVDLCCQFLQFLLVVLKALVGLLVLARHLSDQRLGRGHMDVRGFGLLLQLHDDDATDNLDGAMDPKLGHIGLHH